MSIVNNEETVRRIKELAKSRGIKLGYLTEQMGVDRTYFTTLLRANTALSDERINQIASILNTTPAYLTGESDSPDRGGVPAAEDPVMAEIIQRLYALKDVPDGDKYIAAISDRVQAMLDEEQEHRRKMDGLTK